MNLDASLFLAINQFAGRSPFLDAVEIFLAAYAFLFFGVLLTALWFLPESFEKRRSREQCVLNALCALAGAVLTAHFIGDLFYRARPFVEQTVTQLIPHALDASFPSDHVTLAFALIVTLWPVLGRSGWIWTAWGGAIGLARIFVGVHYPTDVLGGAVLGAAWGTLVLTLSPWLTRFETPLLELLARWQLA